MTTALLPEDFDRFFRSINGHAPFPWQSRLARQVLETGKWPDVLDIPTGCGKTSVLDIALFALASHPEIHPRRIILVVDRRIVVSQGVQHARKLRNVLREPNDSLVHRVSQSLRNLWDAPETFSPLGVAEMRGGMPRDDSWASRPDQPYLSVSTVDQVGSRLLFRGYGISPSMSPVHAGLLGNDCLFLLDEVHLSVPFAETLVAIRDRWRAQSEVDLPDRWGVVRMSATPGITSDDDEVFSLDEADRQNEVLTRRLSAHKNATVVEVGTSGSEDRKRAKVAGELVHHAMDLVQAGNRRLAIIVNRVDTARLVRTILSSHDADMDVFLVTGRMRPLDRDRVTAELIRRLGPETTPESAVRPLIVVATQSIEVGADFDFDAMVTECASIDALRQRFGRLDRRGIRGRTRAVIIGRSDQAKSDAPSDPVYGEALARTWRWLQETADPDSNSVDFGIQHMSLPEDDASSTLITPQTHAPVLLPAYIDIWAQTNPRPWPDPDTALWLHGPDRGLPEVQIVWRADLPQDLMEDPTDIRPDRRVEQDLETILSASPPGSIEALSVPLFAASAWLRDEKQAEIADVVGAVTIEDTSERGSKMGRRAVVWSHEGVRIVTWRDLTPGMTLVVPSPYGGIAHGNWDPESQDPVDDLGDLTQWKQRGRTTLRLHPDIMAQWNTDDAIQNRPLQLDDHDTERDIREELRQWLSAVETEGFISSPWDEMVRHLLRTPFRYIEMPGGHWILVSRNTRSGAIPTFDASSEDDRASYLDREITLFDHSESVRATAWRFARSIGLPDSLSDDIALAAMYHDLGKADPRFQRMLLGGSEIRLALQEEPVAKSAIPASDVQARRLARDIAGYPSGYRHELLSVALLQSCPESISVAHDPDLVMHLIGGHHGWCRPFGPPVPDDEPVEVTVRHSGNSFTASSNHLMARLDSGVTDRFWTLVRRYGWWGLAWLEAVFRLADHHASAMEASGRTIEPMNREAS